MDSINKLFKLNIFKDSIYYKVVFIIWTLIHLLTFGQYITGYFSIIITIWGMILLIKNLLDKKTYEDKVILICRVSFLISYIITILLNIKSNLLGNSKTLIWQAIMLFVIFVNESWKTRKDIKRDIVIISKTIVIITIIFSSISVILFLLNKVYLVKKVDGSMIPMGYAYARLWGIYVDPNQGSVVAIISILSSIIILINKTYMRKYLYLSNICIQYIFMILTASRGGAIGFILSFIMLGYLLFNYILRSRIKKDILRGSISVLISMVLVCIILVSEGPTRRVIAIIPKTISKLSDKDSTLIVDRKDMALSNGRIELWTDGFRLSKFSPIFGFGDRNIPLKAKELTPGSSLEKQVVHNGFIHMILSGGYVALLIMIVLLVYLAYNAIKVFFKQNIYTIDFYNSNIISAGVIVLLATSMFLTEIFYQNSFAATLLWLYLGYSKYLNTEILKEY